MEVLGERSVWSMSEGETVSSLDATYAEIARLETFALHLTARLESTGYAKDVGAGTTARFLTLRYRIDAAKARRDVQLANALSKYPAVADDLPDPNPYSTNSTSAASVDPVDDAGDQDAGSGGGAGSGVLLHPAQAEAIVSTLDKVPTAVLLEDLQVAEREMVELGRTHGPLDLRKAGVQILNRLDTDGPEPAENKAYDRETLKLKKADNGVAFTGYLANENAELFRTLIHLHAKPHKTIDGALDPRPRDKRQADALTTILTTANNPTAPAAATGPVAPRRFGPSEAARSSRADVVEGTADIADASTASSPSHSADRPADTVPGMPADTVPGMPADAVPGMPADEEPAATATAGPEAADGSAPGAVTTSHGSAHHAGCRHDAGFIPGHGPKAHITVTIDYNDLKAATADKIGHLIYGDALSAATIRRLACDAQILPVVLGSNSQPLDVGTTVRLATGSMRKALIVRDKGCVCCGAPPIYCDAHHVKSWIDGGETKITNLVLLCKRCHRDLHAGHWNIQITNGVVHVARPAWATPGPVPRGRYRPPTTTNFSDSIADSTTTGSTPNAVVAAPTSTPTRVWPRETDPPWITPEAAARLNPWGDAPDERPTRAQKLPPDHDFNPWGEESDTGPGGAPRRPAKADFDPWGDGGSSTANVDRHSNLGPGNSATVDPWGDLGAASGDNGNESGDGAEPTPGTAGSWPDSAEPRSSTTTAA